MPAASTTCASARSKTAAVRVVSQAVRAAMIASASTASALPERQWIDIRARLVAVSTTAMVNACKVPIALARSRDRTRVRHFPPACSSTSAWTCSQPQRPTPTLKSRSGRHPSSTSTGGAGRAARRTPTISVSTCA